MVIILMLIHSEMVMQNTSDIQRSLQIEKKSTKADHSTSNKIPLYGKAGVRQINKNASITATILNAASTAANAAALAANAATAAANAATAAASAAIAASNAAIATANTLKEAVKGFAVLEESFPLIDKEENCISAESTTYGESNVTRKTFKTNKAQDTGDRPHEEPLCLYSCLCKSQMSKEKQTASESSSLPGVMSTETRSTSLSTIGTEEETETDILPTKEIKSIICADAIKSTRENIMFNSSTQTILPSCELENIKSDMEVIEKYEDVSTVTKSNIITDIEGQETNDMKVSPIDTCSDVSMVTKPNIINKEGLDDTGIKDTIVTDITVSPNGTLLLLVPEVSEMETGPADLPTVKHTSTKSTSTSTNNLPTHLKVASNELFEVIFSEPLTNEKTETTIIQKVTDIYEDDRKRLQQTIKTGIGQTQTNNEIISPKETLKTEVALTKTNNIEHFENPIKDFKGASNAVTNTTAPMTIVPPTPLNAYNTAVTEESTCISDEYAKEMVCNAATQINIREIPSTTIITIPPTIEKYVTTTSPTTGTYSTIENNATSTDVNTKNINPGTLSIKSSIMATNCVPQIRKNITGIQENTIPVYETKSSKPENAGLESILNRPIHLRTVQTAPEKIDIATKIKGSQLCLDKYESLQEGYAGTMKSEKPLICNNGKLWDVKASTVIPESSSSKMKTQHTAYDLISGIDVPFSYENTGTEEENFMKENEVSKTTRIATLSNKVTSLTPGKTRVTMLPKQRSKISQDYNSLEKIMSINPMRKSRNGITGMSIDSSDIFKSKPCTENIQILPYTILMEESLETGPAITNPVSLTSRENVVGMGDISKSSGMHSHEIPQMSEDCTITMNAPLGSRSVPDIQNISFDTVRHSSSNTLTQYILKNISFQKEPIVANAKGEIYSTNETKDKIHTSMPIRDKLSALGNQNKSKIPTLPKGKTEMLYETVLLSDSIEAFTIDTVGLRTGGASRTFRQALEDTLSKPLSQCKYGIPNLKAKMPLAVKSTSHLEEKNGNLEIVIGSTSTASKNTHKKHAKSGVTFHMESNKPKNLSERIALQARLYEADTSGSTYLRRPMPCARSQETVQAKRDASTLTAEEDINVQPCTTKIRHIPGQR